MIKKTAIFAFMLACGLLAVGCTPKKNVSDIYTLEVSIDAKAVSDSLTAPVSMYIPGVKTDQVPSYKSFTVNGQT